MYVCRDTFSSVIKITLSDYTKGPLCFFMFTLKIVWSVNKTGYSEPNFNKTNLSKPPIKLLQTRQLKNHHITLSRKEIVLLTIWSQLWRYFIIIRYFWYFVWRIKSTQKGSNCGGREPWHLQGYWFPACSILMCLSESWNWKERLVFHDTLCQGCYFRKINSWSRK